MLSTGQLIAERYRLAERIAVGGMGEVWQASDTRLDRTVAVKILKSELSGDAEFLHRFRTEARTTASLNHQGIAAVHDYGETQSDGDAIAFLVMELVTGEPLAHILARQRRLPPERTLDILEQAGRALQAAHERGLVHRDVKPGNILVSPDGTVKLTDFGIAKAAHAAPVTRSGMVMGTAHYIAPEQALGQDAQPTSDVYSLAICGYECLAGARPFLSENAVSVAMMHIRDAAPPLPADVPPGVRAVIGATLVKDPRQRYSGGGEFANAVAAVRAGQPLPVPSGLVASGYPAQPVHAPGSSTAPDSPRTGSQPAGTLPATGTVPPGSGISVGGSGPVRSGTHPSLAPVAPPSTANMPPSPGPVSGKRRLSTVWLLLGLLVTILVVVAAVLLAVLPWSADGDQNTRPGHHEEPADIGGDWPGNVPRSPNRDEGQGMIGTLGRENEPRWSPIMEQQNVLASTCILAGKEI